MTFKKAVVGGAAATILASANTANAINEVEANVALSTDYVFRGISQTNEDPAISGGLDFATDGGFYIGGWASNVNFGEGSDTSTEIDLYLGYAFDVSETVSLDFSYIYFLYPGETDTLNYSEFVFGLSVNDFSFAVVYSPDYFGSDSDAFVFEADYSLGLAENWSLDFHAGYTITDEDDIVGLDVGDDYLEYSLGIATTRAGVDLSLTFHDTDISVSGFEAAEERVVFSVGKAF